MEYFEILTNIMALLLIQLRYRHTRDHSSITSAKIWVGGGGQMLMFADKVGGRP